MQIQINSSFAIRMPAYEVVCLVFIAVSFLKISYHTILSKLFTGLPIFSGTLNLSFHMIKLMEIAFHVFNTPCYPLI